jgi:hypothetical protein
VISVAIKCRRSHDPYWSIHSRMRSAGVPRWQLDETMMRVGVSLRASGLVEERIGDMYRSWTFDALALLSVSSELPREDTDTHTSLLPLILVPLLLPHVPLCFRSTRTMVYLSVHNCNGLSECTLGSTHTTYIKATHTDTHAHTHISNEHQPAPSHSRSTSTPHIARLTHVPPSLRASRHTW